MLKFERSQYGRKKEYSDSQLSWVFDGHTHLSEWFCWAVAKIRVCRHPHSTSTEVFQVKFDHVARKPAFLGLGPGIVYYHTSQKVNNKGTEQTARMKFRFKHILIEL